MNKCSTVWVMIPGHLTSRQISTPKKNLLFHDIICTTVPRYHFLGIFNIPHTVAQNHQQNFLLATQARSACNPQLQPSACLKPADLRLLLLSPSLTRRAAAYTCYRNMGCGNTGLPYSSSIRPKAFLSRKWSPQKHGERPIYIYRQNRIQLQLRDVCPNDHDERTFGTSYVYESISFSNK